MDWSSKLVENDRAEQIERNWSVYFYHPSFAALRQGTQEWWARLIKANSELDPTTRIDELRSGDITWSLSKGATRITYDRTSGNISVGERLSIFVGSTAESATISGSRKDGYGRIHTVSEHAIGSDKAIRMLLRNVATNRVLTSGLTNMRFDRHLKGALALIIVLLTWAVLREKGWVSMDAIDVLRWIWGRTQSALASLLNMLESVSDL